MSNTEDVKKTILIVEDEPINLEMLANVIKDDYKILKAENGKDALEIIEDANNRLSLVLLDLNLPDMNGKDILREMHDKGLLDKTPVVVLTADKDSEVESLDLGASDFIQKPYPKAEVIQARVRRTIELSERRIIIGETERDNLTGLYTREYFYHYCDQYAEHHPDRAMDALAININHFHLINERYGRSYADEVLKRIADNISKETDAVKGFACRRDADNFLMYMPHMSDYNGLLDRIAEGASGEGKDENIVRLRMGVYPNVDKNIDVERSFDRAKLASDTVRSTFTKAVAVYDNALHESSIFQEQLLIDFPRAIEEQQFTVHYQPKYDIRGEEPVLSSAEALVRWNHPEFGMVSPGTFISLFEQNGLIQQLDSYVWRETVRQMKEWKDEIGISVPVSVNVSRIDMFDPMLVEEISSLVSEFDLGHNELVLEVTESAYTEDSEHIINTVESFRNLGFFIEMDDFGTGYSSLNMLSNLPIDALKLDMQFIRTAFKNGKNTRMLEIVIEIADSLNVPVIAEGVETAEQLFTLKAMGCDIVQGYYFSKPVPPEDFEAFLLEKKEMGGEKIIGERSKYRKLAHDRHTYDALHDPVTGLYNSSAFDILFLDADSRHSALLLVDLVDFETVLKDKGKAMANHAIVRAAETLRDNFRASDFICRIKADEIAIILPRTDSSQRSVIDSKLETIKGLLAKADEDAPAVDICYGIAFGDEVNDLDLFEAADTALEKAK